MSNPISLILQSRQGLSQKQAQRLIMSAHMQQALNLLQMPVQELAATIQHEMDQNPVIEYAQDLPDEDELEPNLDQDEVVESSLEFSDKDFEIMHRLTQDFRDLFVEGRGQNLGYDERQRLFHESLITDKPSLFEYLMSQAREVFEGEKDLNLAEVLIGHFDESGFLTTPLEEIGVLLHVDVKELKRVLFEIQNFEPYGVGAKNLQESLLIQLRCLGRKKSLAYQVIDEEYESLLHNRIPEIQRRLKCSQRDLEKAIYKEIAKLDFHPGTSFSHEEATPIVPDVSIIERHGELVVVSNDEEFIPNIRLKTEYLTLLEEPDLSIESKEFIRQKVLSAKWLLRNIHHRGNTLQRIAYSLLKHQQEFFTQSNGQLVPLIMLTLADELELHESTIARAVANKYINTPRGLFPLRFFFTNALGTDDGEISSTTVRDLIQEMIAQEDKRKPLSDSTIAKRLKDKGIECARRTVAKYRSILHLGNAHQRKRHSL